MKDSHWPNNSQLLSDIRSQNRQLIARLYDMYRNEFINFGQKHFGIKEHIAVEIYQDSFLALYQNITNGKLTKLSVSLKTYLFQIGKNKISNYVNRDAKKENKAHTWEHTTFNEPDPEWTHKQEIAYSMVQTMEEPCHTILNLCYWEERSMAYIANAMGYKNQQVAKNRKLICIRKFKNILEKKFRTEGLI